MAGFDRRPLRPALSARPRTVAACPGCSGMALGSSWTVLPRTYPGRPEQHQVMTARGADLGGTPGHWLSDEVGQVLDHGDLGRRCDRLADHVPLARVADHVESGTDVTAWLEHLHDGISGRLSGT